MLMLHVCCRKERTCATGFALMLCCICFHVPVFMLAWFGLDGAGVNGCFRMMCYTTYNMLCNMAAGVISERHYPGIEVRELTLVNGMRLAIKQTDFLADEVLVTAVAVGGLSEVCAYMRLLLLLLMLHTDNIQL
jgi:hypothetical protein